MSIDRGYVRRWWRVKRYDAATALPRRVSALSMRVLGISDLDVPPSGSLTHPVYPVSALSEAEDAARELIGDLYDLRAMAATGELRYEHLMWLRATSLADVTRAVSAALRAQMGYEFEDLT